MKRRLIELALYAAGPISILLTAPILARGLGPEGRGELGVAQSIASFALALGTLGQAEVLLADRRDGIGNLRLSGRISMLGGIISATMGAAILLLMEIDPTLILAALILIPILSQSQLWRSISISKHYLGPPAMNNFGGAVLRVAFLLTLVMTTFLSTATAMFALQLSACLAAIITLRGIAQKSTKFESRKIGLPDIILNIRRGLPLIVFTLLTAVTFRSGIIALQVFSDPKNVGVYAAASSLSMAVLSISGAFKSRTQAAAFLPRSRKRVSYEIRLVTALGMLGATAAIIVAPWIVQILLGPEFQSAIPLIQVLAISSIGLLVLDNVHGLLAVLGQRRAMVSVGAVGAISTVVTLLGFVPFYGAMGAAVSAVVSLTLSSAVGWQMVKKHLN